jgi:hypothetical protein
LQKGWGFSGLDLFSNGKCGRLGPWLVDHDAKLVHHEQQKGGGVELTRTPTPRQIGPRRLVVRRGKRRGQRAGAEEVLTGAWTTAAEPQL